MKVQEEKVMEEIFAEEVMVLDRMEKEEEVDLVQGGWDKEESSPEEVKVREVEDLVVVNILTMIFYYLVFFLLFGSYQM